MEVKYGDSVGSSKLTRCCNLCGEQHGYDHLLKVGWYSENIAPGGLASSATRLICPDCLKAIYGRGFVKKLTNIAKDRYEKISVLLNRLILISENQVKLSKAYKQVLYNLPNGVLNQLLKIPFVVVDGSCQTSCCNYSQTVRQNKDCIIVFITKKHVETLSPRALVAVTAHELAHAYDNNINHQQACWIMGWGWGRKCEIETRAWKLVEAWGFEKELEKLDAEMHWRWLFYREYIYEGPYIYRQKARRQHICHNCGKDVAPGEYYYHLALSEVCVRCVEYNEVMMCTRWACSHIDGTVRRKINRVIKLQGCTHQTAVRAYKEIENGLKMGNDFITIDWQRRADKCDQIMLYERECQL